MAIKIEALKQDRLLWNHWEEIPDYWIPFKKDPARNTPYGYGRYIVTCPQCEVTLTYIAAVGSHGHHCPKCHYMDPTFLWGAPEGIWDDPDGKG